MSFTNLWSKFTNPKNKTEKDSIKKGGISQIYMHKYKKSLTKEAIRILLGSITNKIIQNEKDNPKINLNRRNIKESIDDDHNH